MKYGKTDKIILEKYLSMEPDFDAEGLWDQIEPKIKRKNRIGFWLWYASGISLVVLLAYYQTSFKDTPAHSKSVETLNGQNIALSSETTYLSDQEKKEPNLGQEPIMSIKNSLFSSRDSYSENNIIKQNIVNTRKSSSIELMYSKKTETNETEESALIEDAFLTTIELISSAEQNQNNNRNRTIKSFDLLPSGLSILEYNRQVLAIAGKVFMLPNAQYSNKNKIRLGLSGGYFIHSRSFQHSGLGLNENYINRVGEEKAMDAFDLGLKLDYFITNNLVVFGGVRFDHSFVERNADYVYLESITIPDHTIVIIETEAGTIEETGSVTFDGFYHHKSNNYLTSKRMGLLAGLQYRIGKGKWSSHLNLGVELPLWSKMSGIITNDGKPYNLSDGLLDINNRQPLIFGGIGGEYALSEGVGLQVMIGGYLPTGNEYKESYNIIKKSTQLGVSLGIHFQL